MRIFTKVVNVVEVGRGVGKIVVAAISSAARRIWISSPWIGAYYARALIEKALAGVDVRVITSDLPDNDGKELARAAEIYGEEELREAALRAAYWRRRKRSASVVAVRDPLLLFLAAVLFAYFSVQEPRYSALIAAGIGLAAIGIALALYRVRALREVEQHLLSAEAELERANKSLAIAREIIRRNLKALVVPTQQVFVHAKIYVIDDKAWISSANLTESGMSRNVEVLVEVDPAEAARRFEELWTELSAELSRRS